MPIAKPEDDPNFERDLVGDSPTQPNMHHQGSGGSNVSQANAMHPGAGYGRDQYPQ